MNTRAGKARWVLWSGVLGLVIFSPMPAKAGRAETLTKLAEAANERREALAITKALPAARRVVGGQRQAALLEKLQAAAHQRRLDLGNKPANRPRSGQER